MKCYFSANLSSLALVFVYYNIYKIRCHIIQAQITMANFSSMINFQTISTNLSENGYIIHTLLPNLSA